MRCLANPHVVEVGAWIALAFTAGETRSADTEHNPPPPSSISPAPSPDTGRPSRTLVVKPLQSALRDRGETVIVGGVEADAASYPASFQLISDDRICTWFLVGPQVLLSAAHCVAGSDSTESVAGVALLLGGRTLRAECSIPAGYWKDPSQDWAACRIAEPVAVPGADGPGIVGFEVLDVSANVLALDQKLEISGYGCVTPDGSPVSGYRIGMARVRQLPPDVRLPLAVAKTPNAIKLAQAPAILCEGDSGGPAFRYSDNLRRVVVGINSRTLIRSRVSFLAGVGTPEAKAFFASWADANGVKICGVHANAANCRPF